MAISIDKAFAAKAHVEILSDINIKKEKEGSSAEIRVRINGENYKVAVHSKFELTMEDATERLQKRIEKVIILATRYMHQGVSEFTIDHNTNEIHIAKKAKPAPTTRQINYNFKQQKAKALSREISTSSEGQKVTERVGRIERAHELYKMLGKKELDELPAPPAKKPRSHSLPSTSLTDESSESQATLELDKQAERIQELRDAISGLEERLRQGEEKLGGIEEKIRGEETKHSEAAKAREELERGNDALRKEQQQLEETIGKQQEEKRRLDGIAEDGKELERRNEALRNLEQQLQETIGKQQEALSVLERGNDTLRKEQQRLEETIGKQQEALKGMEKEKKRLDDGGKELERANDALRNEQKKLQETIGKQQEALRELEKEKDKLDAALDRGGTELERLRSSLSDADRIIESKHSTLDEIDRLIEAKRRQLAALDASTEELYSSSEESAEGVEIIREEQPGGVHDGLEEANRQIEEDREKIDELSRRIARLEEREKKLMQVRGEVYSSKAERFDTPKTPPVRIMSLKEMHDILGRDELRSSMPPSAADPSKLLEEIANAIEKNSDELQKSREALKDARRQAEQHREIRQKLEIEDIQVQPNEELQRHVEDLEAQLREMQQSKAAVQTELQRSQEHAAELKKSIEEQHERMVEMERLSAKQKNEVDQAQEKLREIIPLLEKLQRDAEKVSAERQHENDAFAASQAELKRLQGEMFGPRDDSEEVRMLKLLHQDELEKREANIAHLVEQMDNLEKTLMSVGNQRRQWEEKERALTVENEELAAQARDLTAETSKLSETNARLTKERIAAIDEKEIAETYLKETDDENVKLKSEKAELKRNLDKHEKELQELLESEKTWLVERSDYATKSLGQRKEIDELGEKLRKANEELDQFSIHANEDVKDLQWRARRMKEMRESSEKSAEVHKDEVAALENKIQEAIAEKEEAEEKYQSVNQTLANMQAVFVAHPELMEAFQKALAEDAEKPPLSDENYDPSSPQDSV